MPIAVKPISANCFHTSLDQPCLLLMISRRFSNAYSFCTKRLSVSRSWLCSSESLKSMTLESQHHFRNDVPLDFVGAGVDRRLAIVEVVTGVRHVVVGADDRALDR